MDEAEAALWGLKCPGPWLPPLVPVLLPRSLLASPGSSSLMSHLHVNPVSESASGAPIYSQSVFKIVLAGLCIIPHFLP